MSGADQTEEEFLDWYINHERDRYPHAAHTVDIALFTIRDGALSLLLVRRGSHPEKGRWALPGGFVDLGEKGGYGEGEDLDDAARRELLEETGLTVFRGYLEQLRTYGDPDRDRRGRAFSTAYVGMMPHLAVPRAGGDADAARFFPVDELTGPGAADRLAFDHRWIIADALERVRGKIEYEGRLAASFIEEPFTISELRRVYEAVWGGPVHRGDFRRKVLSAKNFLQPTGEATPRTGGPPAQLYRLGTATLLYPPMQRRGMLLDPGREAEAGLGEG
jgi:8-oxo-dGTP diphosphatase